MHLRNYRSLVFCLTAAGLLVGLILLLIAAPMANANSDTLFVSTTGTGTACTQAQPCALQAALSQATDGDTIHVASGVYTGTGSDVIAVTKSIALYGGWNGVAAGPVVRDPTAYPTTLDGENARRVVFISANITPTLDGLRLTNGSTSGDGGGIYANGAHPIVSGSQVFNNTANNSGGGVYLNNSPNARLTDSEIFSNTAKTFFGGGVYVRNGTNSVLIKNTLTHNNARGEGGGAYIVNSSDVLFAGNSVSNNGTTTFGGGVFLGGSDSVRLAFSQIFSNTANQGAGIFLNNSANITLTGNTISNNIADSSAGGIGIFDKSDGATLTGNRVMNNSSGGTGGGVYLFTSANATLVNNLVVENRLTGSGSSGAGIYVNAANARLLHTTIARNSGVSGQGIHVQNDATLWMTNTILVSHTIGIDAGADTTATLTANLWGAGAWANGADTAGSGTIFTGTVNVWGDPVFVDAAGGDYHIGAGSAAIDTGFDAAIQTDIDLEPRPYQGFDIGADEYWPPGALKRIYLPLVVRSAS